MTRRNIILTHLLWAKFKRLGFKLFYFIIYLFIFANIVSFFV